MPFNRNCIVTGGTSGIGYSIVKSLVLEGASVRMITRSRSRGEEAIAKIKEQTGIHAPLSLIEGDLLEVREIDEQWARIDKQNREDQSPINTLINCAGISQNALLQRISNEDISSILRSNLEAPIVLSRRFLKGYTAYCSDLKRRNSVEGSQQKHQSSQISPSFTVINISSLLAQKHTVGTSVYAASKAGLISLTRSLVLEGSSIQSSYSPIAPAFRANVVLPGYIDTKMIAGFSSDHKAKLTQAIPAARFGTADEIADSVMWMLKNEYVNGAELNVDGGLGAI